MDKNKLTEIRHGETGFGLLIEHEGYIKPHENAGKIVESLGGGLNGGGEWQCPDPLVFDAVFQRYGAENANGRIYPEDILKREDSKYQTVIREKRAFGECNHPSDTTIDLSRVAIMVLETHWVGNTLVGKVEVITSEAFRRHGIICCEGDQVANLLLRGYKIGLSSRGVGSVVTKYGKTVVSDDYELICYDVVSDPSTHNAWIVNNSEDGIPREYMESVEKNKPEIFEDLEKFGNWLND